MKVEIVDPRSDSRWQALLACQPSTIFHSPQWLSVLADTYGFAPQAVLAFDRHGFPRAGMPFCAVSDLSGRRLVSLPFSDYCDPLVVDQEQWEQLLQPLAAENCPLIVRCVHNSVPLADSRFRPVKLARWHGLDLAPSIDQLWERLHGAARRAVRKARQQGVVVAVARDPSALRAFFEMHLGVRKHKYRMLAQPFAFFEAIWRHFIEPCQGFLLTASLDRQIIAGVLYLQWQQTLFYKFNASRSELLIDRPNDLLIWEGIQEGKRRGCEFLDFGLSDLDQEGLLRFKRKFADREKTITFLSSFPTATTAGLMPASHRQLFSQLTALFTEESVPDAITERAGDLLYRYFA